MTGLPEGDPRHARDLCRDCGTRRVYTSSHGYLCNCSKEGVVLVEAATKPCETCGGTGKIIGKANGGGATDGEFTYERWCEKCGGSGSVPVVLVDRDALTWTIQKGTDQGGGVRVEAVTGPETERRTVVDRDALIGEIAEWLDDQCGSARMHAFLRRFAPGNREGQ